jgi:hypothetical protein
VAVFRVQGLYLKIENSQKCKKKIARKSEKNKEKYDGLQHCYDDEGAVFRSQGLCLKIE